MNETKTVNMCPFCPLLVEDALCEPVGVDFFGQPAMIGDIPSCDGCALSARMCPNGVQDMLDMLKNYQPEKLNQWGQLGSALARSFEKMEQDSGHINTEYCWMHDGPGMGGWCCNHPDCREQK